jgi:hypothetical protein
MRYRTENSLRNRLRRRLSIDVLEDRTTPTSSTITANFNPTPIAAGNTIWFSSIASFGGLGSSPVTVHFDNGAIDFTAGGTPYHLLVPNGVVVITPGSTTATASYDPNDNDWDVAVPKDGTGHVFLTGVQLPVTANLPGGISHVTWSGNFWADATGVNVNWSWGAAVYKSFSSDYNALGVKPVDNNTLSTYHNGDHAGTPESFKTSVINGATGGGGGNFTGNQSPGAGVQASFGDQAGLYPYPSSNPLTSVVFNESTVLKGANLDLTNGNFELWYSDEHAMALGVSQVNVTTSTGTTTTNYPVTPLTSDPGSALNAAVGSQITSGDQAGTDLSGRPMFPSLFITDTTTNPKNTSGDWQWGGTSLPPSAIFGTWKSVTRTVNNTTSTPTVTVTCGLDPVKNNWVLGPGSDAPPATLQNEGYGAEARWSLTALQQAGILVPGHNYRFYVIVHDGDQNKAGGDCGQAVWNYSYPGVVTPTASIAGSVVVISTGAPVAGVEIDLVDATGAVVQHMLSGTDGSFSFTNVAPGTYSLHEGAIDTTQYYYWGNNAGMVGGVQDGSFVDLQDIGSITLNSGDAGINYVFNLGLNSAPPT